MPKVKVVCTESRPIGHDLYIEGESYSVDADRAAKYAVYFVPADSAEAVAKIAALAVERQRRAGVEAQARGGVAEIAAAPELPTSSSGMTEGTDIDGGFVVPEDAAAEVLHDPGPGGVRRGR